MTSSLLLRSNRAVKLFQAAAGQAAESVGTLPRPVCFSHWETFGNTPLPTDDLPAGTRIIRLLDRAVANRLSHKGSLARLLKRHGLTHLAPATYTTVEAAVGHSGPRVGVWFFKHASGTAGKNMYCVATPELALQTLPPNYVIQAEIDDIELIEECKFTTRVYVLLWNERTWIYRDGFMLKHGVPYEKGSTDYAVQIDHRGYHLPDSPVRMSLLSSDPNYPARFDTLAQLTQALMPVINECRSQTHRDCYLILGIDMLFQNSGNAQLVEINTSPNFVHSEDINSGLNIPFLTAVIRTTLGAEEERLLEIA